jgi:Rho termination factor, N-terminal domain
MPYTITGCDSAGERHDYLMDDAGVITGDALLTGWLAENPLPAREGETPTDTELEAVRQHVSKLLTVVQMAAVPPVEPPPLDPLVAPSPAAGVRYTAADLTAMTAAEVRELATAAHVLGAASMTKAELVAALLAQQGA